MSPEKKGSNSQVEPPLMPSMPCECLRFRYQYPKGDWEHLEHCPHCARWVEEELIIARWFTRSLPYSFDTEASLKQLHQRLVAEPQPSSFFFTFLRYPRRLMLLSGATAALALFLATFLHPPASPRGLSFREEWEMVQDLELFEDLDSLEILVEEES